MTRLLYLPDDTTVVQLETDLPAAQLCAAVNAGLRPLPILRAAPPGKLAASEVGATVVIAPAVRSTPARSRLSRRQTQVSELAARGFSSGEIAALLQLSRRTVNYHLSQVKNRVRGGEIQKNS